MTETLQHQDKFYRLSHQAYLQLNNNNNNPSTTKQPAAGNDVISAFQRDAESRFERLSNFDDVINTRGQPQQAVMTSSSNGNNNFAYGYYPDSDLETIVEESSILDSEDERGKLTTVGAADADDSDDSGSTLSEFSVDGKRRVDDGVFRSGPSQSEFAVTSFRRYL